MSRYGLRKLLFRLKSAILMRYYAVNRTHFSAQLAFGKKLGSNSTFMFSKKLCAKFNSTHRVIFIKLSFVLGCHSLLTHLLTSEFAVLPFDCERYKLAAQSIP